MKCFELRKETRFIKINVLLLLSLCLSAQNKGEDKDKDEDTKDHNGSAEAEDTKPRALHKTLSIFLRNLAPSITKQEVESVSRSNVLQITSTDMLWECC